MRFSWLKPYPAILDRIEGRLARIEQHLQIDFTAIERHQAMTDHTLDDILADTTAERSEIDALATLAAGIKLQLDQALSGATLTPAQQARVNAIFTNIEANKEAITASILANTPAGPQPPPPGGGTVSVTVTSSKSPSAVGEPVTLTAAMASTGTAPTSANAPITGSVDFKLGDASVGVGACDSTGVAAISVSTLPAGDNSIVANYSGDANYAAASGTIVQTVTA